MDFSATVTSHIKWLKDILYDMETNPDALAADTVARDDVCEIGQWLHAHQQEYGHIETFSTLLKAHADLHKAAADAIQLAHEGHYEEARLYLSPGGRFIEKSKHLLDHASRFFALIDD